MKPYNVPTELFVPYNEALELKNLGIGEFITYACGFYYTLNGKEYNFVTPSQFDNIDETYDIGNNFYFAAPLYQQSFKFFRENYGLYCYISPFISYEDERKIVYDIFILEDSDEEFDWDDGPYSTYEEAELECLRKLIELCKEKDG